MHAAAALLQHIRPLGLKKVCCISVMKDLSLAAHHTASDSQHVGSSRHNRLAGEDESLLQDLHEHTCQLLAFARPFIVLLLGPWPFRSGPGCCF